jgi:hypothetical protein
VHTFDRNRCLVIPVCFRSEVLLRVCGRAHEFG